MIHNTEIIHDGAISFEYYGDDHFAHYILSGERFKHQNALLELISQYKGACTEDPKMYAIAGKISCDFNCRACPKSIYHQIELKERFFNNRCKDSCLRYPREGDEWEVSIHTLTDHPHYEDFFFKALKTIEDRTIIELSFDEMMKLRPDFLTIAKYCYVKIRRSDMENALDVSIFANTMYHEMLEKENH